MKKVVKMRIVEKEKNERKRKERGERKGNHKMKAEVTPEEGLENSFHERSKRKRKRKKENEKEK